MKKTFKIISGILCGFSIIMLFVAVGRMERFEIGILQGAIAATLCLLNATGWAYFAGAFKN
jgi:hypothetical protein